MGFNKYKYNFWQSSGIINIIERAFGVLKKRFPILCYPFSNDDEFMMKVVQACAMHNIYAASLKVNGTHDYKMWIESWEAPPGLNE